MNVIPNTRWASPAPIRARRPANEPGYEPATAATDRLLMLRLSELRAAKREAKRIEAEIATLARRFADERGETMRPTVADLARRLGVPQ